MILALGGFVLYISLTMFQNIMFSLIHIKKQYELGLFSVYCTLHHSRFHKLSWFLLWYCGTTYGLIIGRNPHVRSVHTLQC